MGAPGVEKEINRCEHGLSCLDAASRLGTGPMTDNTPLTVPRAARRHSESRTAILAPKHGLFLQFHKFHGRIMSF